MEAEDLTGLRKVLANPWVATIITVVLGVGLGMTGYTIIWPLFGAANQLLAALALLAVCAWLGNAGRNNKMFYVPMASCWQPRSRRWVSRSTRRPCSS